MSVRQRPQHQRRPRQHRHRHQRPGLASVVVAAGLLLAGGAGNAVEPGEATRAAPVPAAVAERFARPLTDTAGDAERGRAVAFDRERGNCIVCHAIPAADVAYHGNLGPPLAGIGSRLGAAELRVRLVDSRLVDAHTLMPPYHATNGLVRVAERYAGRPVLTAQEIEDVVAFLSTLRN